MEANFLSKLKEQYLNKFTGGIFENVNVDITLSEKKIDRGSGSMTITVTNSNDVKSISTVYIMENGDVMTVLYVNDNTKDIVFSNRGKDAVKKAEAYIVRYVEHCTSKMLGIKITEK